MLSLSIAKRFVWSSRVQSLIIILGIAVGVSVQIFVGLLIDSLQKNLLEQTVGRSAHLTVVPGKDADYFEWNDELQTTLLSSVGLKGWTRTSSGNSFLFYDNQDFPLLLKGFDYDRAEDIYKFSEALYEGRLPDADLEIALGRDLQKELGVKLGDKIEITTAQGAAYNLTVVGLFDLKVAQLNLTWGLLSLPSASTILQIPDNYISAFEAQFEDPFAAKAEADLLIGKLDQAKFVVQNWEDQNQALLSALQGQGSSSLMIQVFVMLSVVIAIASVLAITVMQKSRQIGILKAMGLTDRQASLIFIFQGFILGLGGAVLGAGLGFGLFYSFVTFARTADGSAIVEGIINYQFMIVSALIALAVSTLAGLVPARKSARLSPIEVIRNG